MDNLRLRKFREDDFEAFHAIVSDYEVVKMLGSWPHPAVPEFTRERMFSERASAVSAIEYNGQLVGSIGGVDGGIGYLLNPSFWGRGITTWAVGQKVREMFRGSAQDNITTYVWNDNPASAVVLRKHGFKETRQLKSTSKARGGEVDSAEYVLTRADWATKQLLHIKTERLVLRPFEVDDAAAIARLLNDNEIARMFRSISYPFTTQNAVDWIAENNGAGVMLQIIEKTGAMVGFIGIVHGQPHLHYGLGRAYWGKGYVTEAAEAFLNEVHAIHKFDTIAAGAMFDNIASQRVLEKLGFVRNGEKMHKTAGRVEEAPLFLYRLDKSKFRTKQ